MNWRPGDDLVFRAMADPARRALLDRLHAADGQTLGELCEGLLGEGLAMTRQAVSKHLAVLEAADLVTTLREGRRKLHFLNPMPIQAIADRWIGKYRQGPARALADLKRNLEGDER
jgi:DNA-binding transcriptional ArsR family regulator